MTDSALIGPVAAPDLHVMSYNIRRRLPHMNPRSPDRWVHRQPLLKRLLRAEQPALLGVQEALFDQAGFVRHTLGEHYRSIGHGREANTGGEGCPIFYDSRRLSVLGWRQTALSDTPKVPGSTSWGNRVPRIVVDATFVDLATGIEFQAVNTHLDHRSRKSRLRSADELRRIVTTSPLPTIMTGDFNTDADTDPTTNSPVRACCWMPGTRPRNASPKCGGRSRITARRGTIGSASTGSSSRRASPC